jgi:hypothetical protein
MIAPLSHTPTETPSTPVLTLQTQKSHPPSKIPVPAVSPTLKMVTGGVRKPSQHVLDIIRETSTVHRGVQLPMAQPQIVKETMIEGENAAEHLMVILEDGDNELCFLNSAMVIGERIAEAKALKPNNLVEAKCHPNWAQWEAGIREELATLQMAGTWELTDLPPGANFVGSKWVFQAKKDAARNIVHHKARLVAQGFSQVPGVDFFDTYAPVTTLSSIRMTLAFSA